MANNVVVVYLLVVIVGVLVLSSQVFAKPKNGLLYENCPRGTVPSNSLFDPAVGKFQLSCRKVPMPVDECILLDDDNQTQSFKCPPNYALMGRDQQRPVCCKLKGIRTTDCFIPKKLYSFIIGFEFPIAKGYALVGKFSYGSCSEDPTVFMIEICKLTKRKKVKKLPNSTPTY